MKNISEKAMLVRISISQWTARKLDRKITKETNDRYRADQDAGRYNKALIAQEAVKKVQKAANAARTFHYENTLPWSDDGARLLPAANYLQYTQKMNRLKDGFEKSIADFLANYPALVQEAKQRLNGMFNASDYPHESDISRKYGFAVSVDPVPAAGDFRVSLQDEEIKAIRADIEQRAHNAQAHAMRDLWQRLFDNVQKMSGRLADSDAVFRDSLVRNLCDLCELLPRLNITNDPDLESMRRAVEEKLCAHEPQELRKDQTTREQTAQAANDILAKMAGFVGKQ